MSEFNETQPVVQHTSVLDHAPEVRAFVAAVRRRLADLTEEEREELVGGLDADMSDLVAERGVEALPEPVAYATELRTAAGFSPEPVTSDDVTQVSLGQRVNTLLDRGRDRWEGFAGGLPGSPWEFLVALRPAWWVLRAWVALQLVDLVWGSGGYNYGLSPIPSLYDWGLPLLLLAIAVSVQLGRGKLWPGSDRTGIAGRVLLLALNAVALAATPATLSSVITTERAALYATPAAVSQPGGGLAFNGEPVANIYPYDAQGHPLTGVQLVDRQGRRLSLTQGPYNEGSWGEFVHAPWLNGRTQLYSVFPLPEQTLDPDTQDPVGDPRLQVPPFASLPPVTASGVQPSVLLSPAQVEQQRAKAAQKAAQARQKALKAEQRRSARSGNGD